ncbi:hypothetical protein RGQ29_024326 [Quercus rubra]|uniref:Uncharacterized protein n=1 Tax=Quercus rubra TaxID=3512 RepID=A0AAN7EVW0_QUERU|nr:hypothetical protein RGQ29_024326 [Quercus rubra]
MILVEALLYCAIGLYLDETQLYIEDWIGLKTLDEAGRVKYISVPGYHLDISQSDIEDYVLPYL